MKKTLLITLCIAASGMAQDTRKPIFVSPEQLDLRAILPAPTPNDSWQTMAELAELHKIQQTRTPTEIAHAQKDDVEEHMFIFQDVLGPKFKREALPATALFSDHIKNDEGVNINAAKNFFKRNRPYHMDATIKPVCKATDNRMDYGYPSGHGTTGYLEALALIQMVPEKRNEILARADDYAHSREVCGAHFASDEAASKAAAYAMMAVMMNNSQFQQELAAAKAETRATLGY